MSVKARQVAVVDIGSSAIRTVVAEIIPDGEWRTLDQATKPIPLGRDVFRSGVISTESMREAIAILMGFRELLDGWQIPMEEVRVIATAAIREARNRDTFLDRVKIRTGLRIDVVEGVEENHLTYVAVQHAINDLRPQIARSSAMILEVGGGTTEVMLLQRGKMVAAHSLRIGTVRVEQQVRPLSTLRSNDQIEEYLRENIRVNQDVLDAELRLDRIRFFVAVGGDARIAAARVGRQEAEHFSVIDRDDFVDFIRTVQRRNIDECVRELSLTYNEAEGLLPALVTYKLFMEATQADQLIVPDVSIRDGVILQIATGDPEKMRLAYSSQVLTSTLGLGRKYHFDEKHGVHVAKLAAQLFDQLEEEHAMDGHAKLLLRVAATLHDIGNYIRASGHHKHGQYILDNSEVFGLSRTDMRIVANVVRYHRRGRPNSAHTAYVSLRREQRMNVLKLAAILRVADALDRGHAQRITDVEVERTDDDIVVRCMCVGDISIEQNALLTKGTLFEEIYGYRVVAI